MGESYFENMVTCDQKKLSLPLSTSRAMKNTDFLSSKLETAFQNWEERNVIMWGQLFKGGDLMPFEQLPHQYNLPANDFFWELRLRHCGQKHGEWGKRCILPTNTENFFMLTIKGEHYKDHIIFIEYIARRVQG